MIQAALLAMMFPKQLFDILRLNLSDQYGFPLQWVLRIHQGRPET